MEGQQLALTETGRDSQDVESTDPICTSDLYETQRLLRCEDFYLPALRTRRRNEIGNVTRDIVPANGVF